MKVIPVYLPQFHCIPENDKWWGKGFTEWSNVKGAKPLFEGHNQPRVPLNDNYYDLSDVAILKWQCELARKYGIYGFCMYHYWFSGKTLLEKPMEMLLAHPEIDIHYCISWANGEWRDTWKHKDTAQSKILIFDDYDNEQLWVDHFNYMLPFFKDKRYMKEDGKPILVIYAPHLIPKLNKMLDLWESMAKQEGLAGLTLIYQSAASSLDRSWDRSHFKYGVEMNPGYAHAVGASNHNQYKLRLIRIINHLKRKLNIKRSLYIGRTTSQIKHVDYDQVWQKILSLRPEDGQQTIPCAFTDWDNSPRVGKYGIVYDGVNTHKFYHYFALLCENAKKYYKSDKVFIFAWNEWAEGGYLEPDKLYGYGFLEAIKKVLDEEQQEIV